MIDLLVQVFFVFAVLTLFSLFFLHFARVADRRRGGAFAAVILPS